MSTPDIAAVLAAHREDDAAHVAAILEPLIREREAEALREAARFFEYDMAPAWGGDASWISTGSHVADLVADVLRERAFDLTDGAA